MGRVKIRLIGTRTDIDRMLNQLGLLNDFQHQHNQHRGRYYRCVNKDRGKLYVYVWVKI